MRSLCALIVAAAIFAAGMVTYPGLRPESPTATPATDAASSTANLKPKPAAPDVPLIRMSLAAIGSTIAKDQATAHATAVAPSFAAVMVAADAVKPAAPRSPSLLIVPLRI